jgi:phage major head subunit gpT-like protein
VVTLRTNTPDLLEEKFRSIMFNSFMQHPDQYSRCFNVLQSKKNNEHLSGMSGLGMPGSKAEGASQTYDDPEQLWDTTFTNVTYAQGYRVSMEAMDDDQYGILGQRMFGTSGKGFKQRVEVTAANVFNNGFTTQLADDGVALFSTSHTRNPNDATTHANAPSTAGALSVSTLKTAITNFEDTLDHRGLNMRLIPKKLVVPTALRFTAEEILQSQLEPYVAENQKNVLREEGLSVEVNNYLTDTNNWFLLAEKSDHELLFFWRKQLTFKRDSDFDSWDAKFAAIMRFVAGVQGWRGTYGNNPS